MVPIPAQAPPDPAPRLSAGQLHELHADIAGWAAAQMFALAHARESAPILLVRSARDAALPTVPYGEALAQLGIDPARLIIVDAPGIPALLRAGLEGARCNGLGAVVIETWGAIRDYDLVASRRLVLAAETSRVPVILLRGEAEPRASAAHTRWHVRSAPSTPQAARAPGPATITLDLLRQRGGPAGASWRLEWNEDDACFRNAPAITVPGRSFGAVMAGTVVSMAALRKGEAVERAENRPKNRAA